MLQTVREQVPISMRIHKLQTPTSIKIHWKLVKDTQEKTKNIIFIVSAIFLNRIKICTVNIFLPVASCKHSVISLTLCFLLSTSLAQSFLLFIKSLTAITDCFYLFILFILYNFINIYIVVWSQSLSVFTPYLPNSSPHWILFFFPTHFSPTFISYPLKCWIELRVGGKTHTDTMVTLMKLPGGVVSLSRTSK